MWTDKYVHRLVNWFRCHFLSPTSNNDFQSILRDRWVLLLRHAPYPVRRVPFSFHSIECWLRLKIRISMHKKMIKYINTIWWIKHWFNYLKIWLRFLQLKVKQPDEWLFISISESWNNMMNLINTLWKQLDIFIYFITEHSVVIWYEFIFSDTDNGDNKQNKMEYTYKTSSCKQFISLTFNTQVQNNYLQLNQATRWKEHDCTKWHNFKSKCCFSTLHAFEMKLKRDRYTCEHVTNTRYVGR